MSFFYLRIFFSHFILYFRDSCFFIVWIIFLGLLVACHHDDILYMYTNNFNSFFFKHTSVSRLNGIWFIEFHWSLDGRCVVGFLDDGWLVVEWNLIFFFISYTFLENIQKQFFRNEIPPHLHIWRCIIVAVEWNKFLLIKMKFYLHSLCIYE